MPQPEPIEYIREAVSQNSRYEIDQKLLRAGYDPAEIDSAWQQLALDASRIITRRTILRSRAFWVFILSLLLLTVLFFSKRVWPIIAVSIYVDFGLALISLICLVGSLLSLRAKFKSKSKSRLDIFLLLSIPLLAYATLAAVVSGSITGLELAGSHDGPREIAFISANGHDYHLIYSYTCIDDCSEDLTLYRCDFFNLYCPHVGSLGAIHSLSEVNWVPFQPKRSLPFQNENTTLVADNSSRIIKVLQDGKLYYNFVVG